MMASSVLKCSESLYSTICIVNTHMFRIRYWLFRSSYYILCAWFLNQKNSTLLNAICTQKKTRRTSQLIVDGSAFILFLINVSLSSSIINDRVNSCTFLCIRSSRKIFCCSFVFRRKYTSPQAIQIRYLAEKSHKWCRMHLLCWRLCGGIIYLLLSKLIFSTISCTKKCMNQREHKY